jgi:membrane-associated protein
MNLSSLIDVILHLDVYLSQWSQQLGPWLYVVVFLVIFAETGLVVAPFLPGDSLLFAVGALCSLGESGLRLELMLPLLWIAAVLGDAANYSAGKMVGPKVFTSESSWLLNRKHLLRTQAFYEKHGGKTIILSRFMPILRTFAPFVAGIGAMSYKRFFIFNVVGAGLWVGLFLPAGYIFGNLPSVKSNFHVVILAIIVLSCLPLVVEFIKARRTPATHLS